MRILGLGSLLSVIFVAGIFFTVSVGCGGSSSGNPCTGTVMYQGKTFEGAGKDETDAKHFACNNYCRDADPEYEARYRIWLDSPKGKAAGSPSKQEAIFKDADLLKFVNETCATRCQQEMNPTATCSK